ncbi:MAG: ATP-binding cassette domain-containing protein [Litoreibacter sp.]
MVAYLTLNAAQVHRRKRRILGPIDHEFSQDGLTVVLGPNGSGKTTLLRTLHGLERLSEGHVNSHVSRHDQAFVFQTPIMLRRSVRDNLIYPPAFRALKLNREKIDENVSKWLNIIGLSEAPHHPAQRLSGGEKQKLALARALITRPKLLFLDEPSANLDGRSTREIEQILTDARDAGVRIILTTHDIAQARRLADDALFLLGGCVHEFGSAKDILIHPQHTETKSFLNGEIVE